jgi:glucokinase
MDGGLVSIPAARYRNDESNSLAELIDRYRRDSSVSARRAFLALALPVGAGEMKMTNRDWSFSAEGLRLALGLQRLRLVNDFVAAASGVGALSEREVTHIGGRIGNRSDPRLILGPGTGLGAAAILTDERGEQVIATEAGHMGAAPTSEIGRAVCGHARLQHGRASWERLLSGDGLALFDAVARGANDVDSTPEVAARAQSGDAAARVAARAFSYTIGEFAGDLCLAFRATSGVYLVGGVLHGLGDAFDADALRSGFENKGRFSSLLREVPCFVVRTENLALRGLARLLEGAVHAPFFEAGDVPAGAAQ